MRLNATEKSNLLFPINKLFSRKGYYRSLLNNCPFCSSSLRAGFSLYSHLQKLFAILKTFFLFELLLLRKVIFHGFDSLTYALFVI